MKKTTILSAILATSAAVVASPAIAQQATFNAADTTPPVGVLEIDEGILPGSWKQYNKVCDDLGDLRRDGIVTFREELDAADWMIEHIGLSGGEIYPNDDRVNYMKKVIVAKQLAAANTHYSELADAFNGVKYTQTLTFEEQVYRCVRTHAARLFSEIYGLTVDPYELGVWHKNAVNGFRAVVCDAGGIGTEKELVFFVVAEADGYKWTKKGSTTKYTLTDTAPAKGWTNAGQTKVAVTLRVHLQSRQTTDRDTDFLVNDRNENCHNVPRTFVEITELYNNDKPNVPTGYGDDVTGAGTESDPWGVFNLIFIDDNNAAAKEGSQWGVSMLSHSNGQPIATKYIGTANRYNYEDVILEPADTYEVCLNLIKGRVVVDAYNAKTVETVMKPAAALLNKFDADACSYYDQQLGAAYDSGIYKTWFNFATTTWRYSEEQLSNAAVMDLMTSLKNSFFDEKYGFNAADREIYAICYARLMEYIGILQNNEPGDWDDLKAEGFADYNRFWGVDE